MFLKFNKSIVESYFSRLEEVEDQLSGLKDKIYTSEKIEEFLDTKT
jgi:Mg2+ and Co2+ transporter CorA